MKLYRNLCICLFLVNGLHAQVQDTMTATCFAWSTPAKGDYGFGEIDASIDTEVIFFGDYKSIEVCDWRFYWKCSPEGNLYERKNGEFVEIKNTAMFNDKLDKLTKLINDSIQADYKKLKTEYEDCFEGVDAPSPLSIDDIQIYFSEKWITFVYDFGLISACDVVGGGGRSFTWNEILPYLKNQNIKTPSYCTPSGPKVNVRSEPSVKSAVSFQLDKGEFFEILEVGNRDVVNEKDGYWYTIDDKGKRGYIFSFYTLCKID